MVFISYSRSDINDARLIVAQFRRDGIECWFDESNIPVGEAFVVQLGEGLAQADAFVLIDTPASRSSYWVNRERTMAFRLRRERPAFKVARLFSPEVIESTEAWGFSAPLTLAGRTSLLDSFHRETLPLGPSELARDAARSTFREGHFGQPQNWSGRQEEFERLDSWWLGLRPGVWIQGLGGSGKSGLIQTWVTALDYLGYDRAESIALLFLVGREITNAGAPYERLLRFLSKTTGIQRALLVLDGFDEASDGVSADQLLHQALARSARVLVSSRSEVPMSLRDDFVNINVDVMSRRDTVAFLSQKGIAGQDGPAVAEELGDHPLAVLLFSQFAAKHNLRPAVALKQLQLERLRHHRHAADGVERAVDSIGLTVKRAIASVSPFAQSLLFRLCRANGSDLKWPQCLPVGIRLADALKGVRELISAGLLQADRLDEPSELAIHDLIIDFVRSQGEADHSE